MTAQAPLFDTHRTIERLINSGGFDKKQAESIADAVNDGLTGGVATSADIETLRANMRADIETLRADMQADGANIRADIETLRADMRADGANIRADIETLRTDIETLRANAATRTDVATFRADMAGLETRIWKVRGIVALFVTGGSIAGLIAYATHLILSAIAG